ncbi:exodeoxyribonuclease VII large subunit [Acinetobacter sp. ACNIH3]|jgi:exodeoxyribonuclease VII large subunit|uniref:exodeoxyribonuclease VII large subunit n=1 Tax=Acinetobacter TaxID=469 RepID=UPI000CDD06B6|nr:MULTISPECIES: exodeoxyribonuclease VII large subunit [Acinetobacter]POU19733.1 exodeoxyribonuclease VII large subunit [Acinetobacter sp. ACNIH3]POV80040.1 exodeoxyribonuclease VII large subunit [Acinetobacter sp. ACNIH4]
MQDPQFSLKEYLSTVQEVIKLTFDTPVWVKAEIRNLNIKAGHYYLELAEKDPDNDQVIASCRATIWKFAAQKIVTPFERETGIELSRDLNVLIKVKASFDPQYGFSLNIVEIDSSYTLGDIARRYQEIVQRLTAEGLIERNRQLPTPFDLNRILVIAPENAAGLGDFKKDADALADAQVCEFVYHSATFQGNTAPQSIRQSLAQGLKQWAEDYTTAPDLIVVIRGGGAVNDLAYLNDYELAALLCKRSVPIWVGIGHEKDRTILDEIAHRSFDTPSKVIAGIRNHIVERVQDVITNLQIIQRSSRQQIQAYQNQNDQLMTLIQSIANTKVSDAFKEVTQLRSNISNLARQQTRIAQQQIEALLRETLIQNPKTVLSKGYAIVRQQGHAVRSVHELESEVQVEMQDGTFVANITQVNLHE